MLFNHWNPETYHFANWVLHSGHFNVAALIEEAAMNSQASDEVESDWPEVHEQLAGLLESAVNDLTHDFAPDYAGLESWSVIGDAYPEDDPINSLFLGLLSRAVELIDFETAAKMILMERAGAAALSSVN